MFVGKNPKTEKQGTDCFFGGVGQPGTEGVVLLRNTKSSQINYTNHEPYQKVLFACTVPLQSRKSAPRTEIAELAIRVGTKTSSCDHLMSKGVSFCISVRCL